MNIGPAILTSSIETCARHCLHKTNCLSFDFHQENGKCWLKSMQINSGADNTGAAGTNNYERMEPGYATCTDPLGVQAPDGTFRSQQACTSLGDCRNSNGDVTMLRGVSAAVCDMNVAINIFVPNVWRQFDPCYEVPDCWLDATGWDTDGNDTVSQSTGRRQLATGASTICKWYGIHCTDLIARFPARGLVVSKLLL
eukprot:COSAG01_NODE_22396_length_857_cov_1.761214_2_plen_196_part_01